MEIFQANTGNFILRCIMTSPLSHTKSFCNQIRDATKVWLDTKPDKYFVQTAWENIIFSIYTITKELQLPGGKL